MTTYYGECERHKITYSIDAPETQFASGKWQAVIEVIPAIRVRGYSTKSAQDASLKAEENFKQQVCQIHCKKVCFIDMASQS